MYDGLVMEEVSYPEKAPGWVDGVYYPRVPVRREKSFSGMGENGYLKLHSRVWQEIEETGYGVYYYEETDALTAELDGSDYRVELLLVNPGDSAYACHGRVNGVLKADAVTVEPGEEKKVSLIACMTDGSFSLTLTTAAVEEIHSDMLEGDVFVKNIEITPCPARQRREKPHVYLASDSTVQSYARRFYPQTGWGQVFCQFFRGGADCREQMAEGCDYSIAKTYELPGLVIENRSIGGRSARSFYNEGKLDQILEAICPGDYMFVQFAHNDASTIRPNRYIAPEEFPDFLQMYVDGCERRGAQCVFVTPVSMRVLDENGKHVICFGEYRDQMMKLAREKDIPLLDLGGRSRDYLDKIGQDKSLGLYLWLEPGEYPEGAYAEGVNDRCHLQEYGARIYADMVAQMITEYDRDDRLDPLKIQVMPVPDEQIKKPVRKTESRKGQTGVTGFVVQEISVEAGRGNFLLNWNPVEGAISYHVYMKEEKDPAYILVRTVTREEKEKAATLPFIAKAGQILKYYVAAVTSEGVEKESSQEIEVDLR